MSASRDLYERVRFLLRKRREDHELDEELRVHAEMEAAYQQRRGATEDDARRLGLIALGGIERTKEDVRDARGTRLVDDTQADVRFSIRTLIHNPGFSLVAVLTLAVGIGGTTAVFSAVDAVLLQPLPYQQPGQLVRLYQSDIQNPADRGYVTPVHYLAFRQNLSSLEATTALRTYDETGADIGAGASVRRIKLLPVSADYFDVVRVHPTIGRGFQADDEIGAPVVVLSHALWAEHFGTNASVVGRTLDMNGKPYTVAGVMPEGFLDPIAGAVDAWVPLDLRPGKDLDNVDNHYLSVIGRLRSGLTVTRGDAELDALMLRLSRQFPLAKDARAHLYPLKEDIVGSSSRALEIMLGAVGLVLLLVCVNIANLMLVRGSARSREFAVRAALGAGRARLVRQMLIESLSLAVAGDLAGLAVARGAMSAIVVLGRDTIPRLSTLTLDGSLLAFSLAIATVSAVVFGMAPALGAARTDPGDVLRDETRSSTGGHRITRLREMLVASQVALAFVLLVGAGLLLTSFERIRSVNLGVAPAGVLTFELHLPDARYDSTARAALYDELPPRLAALRGVRAVGAISRLPATRSYHRWGTRALTGPLANTKQGRPAAQQRIVSGDYFRAVGIPLLAGRMFDARDEANGLRHVVVSKGFADRLFPKTNPIGQRFNTGGRDVEIIGVVGDVSVDNEGGAEGFVYHLHRQFAGDRNWALSVVVAAAAGTTVQPADIRQTIASIDPRLVMYKPALLDDVIGQGAAQRVFTLRILMAFAGVAIALAALGLFGVLSYGVRLRSREFGIRMALGADRGSIRRMVLERGLAVAGIGIVVGLLGAAALSRVMVAALFHASPLEPVVLASAVALMCAVAGVAAYLPARRATNAEPRAALQ